MDNFCKGARDGWVKYKHNPVLGGELGVCFDICMIKENALYRMWFSWRDEKCVALTESADGVNWSAPVKCLTPNPESGWEDEINRCSVLFHDGIYYMWYTGQTWTHTAAGSSDEGYVDKKGICHMGQSKIGFATSKDGAAWRRFQSEPVLSPCEGWEKVAVMCPNVLWDEKKGCFAMWYSAGDQYEPDAIGYAVSTDGVIWERYAENPIFSANPDMPWESHKCTACQVILYKDWYFMFYIGFQNEDYAQIGLARSHDGITGWERSPANPIIAPDDGAWDSGACYKPFAIPEEGGWKLWYNGRRENVEQIGLASRKGEWLTF